MKYGALLGWGVVIYAVMSLLWSGLIIYNIADSSLSLAIRILVLLFVTTVAGRSLRFHSWKDILPYSVVWAITMGILDWIYIVPFSGLSLYTDWYLWVGYTLVAVVPLLTPLVRPLPEPHKEY